MLKTDLYLHPPQICWWINICQHGTIINEKSKAESRILDDDDSKLICKPSKME